MLRKCSFSLVGCSIVVAILATEASGQYGYGSRTPYGSAGGGYGSSYQSRYQQPNQSYGGGYAGSPTYNATPQLSGTYPPAPRVRRPVISPYLNLNRREGLVGGVPNYYSLVRPRVQAFDRYQSGVATLRRNQQENERRQQELYLQQQRDYQSLVDRMDEEIRILNDNRFNSTDSSVPTQYRRPALRPTGHGTSFGAR